MLGVIVNTLAVIFGSLIGIVVKRGISDSLSDAVMKALGLCTIVIGISGAVSGGDPLVMILSMTAGVIVGTMLDIDGHMNRFSTFLEQRLHAGEGSGFSQGFLSATLFACIGAMAIVGSFNAGLTGDYEILFTKSILDFITCVMLAGAMGVGVLFAAVPLFLYQGTLVLLSHLLQNVLTDQGLINQINVVGSLMIIAIGLNILGITKIKVADLLPALLFVPLMYALIGYLSV